MVERSVRARPATHRNLKYDSEPSPDASLRTEVFVYLNVSHVFLPISAQRGFP